MPTFARSVLPALLATVFLFLAQGVAAEPVATTIESYLVGARARTVDAARAKGLDLPQDFLEWIDADPLVRASVFGCRRDPLPVLLALRSLEIDLGADVVRRDYTQLALAFAIQDSYAARGVKGTLWNDADGARAPDRLPDVSARTALVLSIPTDPRVRVDTIDAARVPDRDDHIINFLEDHAEIEVEVRTKELPALEYDEKGVAKPRGAPVTVMKKVRRPLVGADVIASASLQGEFNAYMAAHGHSGVSIDCGDRAVHWYSEAAVEDAELRKRIAAAHALFHDAYRAKGRMPAERDGAPSAAESMAWLIRNDRHAFSVEERAARQWPRFPLKAPWPVLLMLAADDQPLREREDIWTKFRDSGEFRTYGEYIGAIAQQFDMQSARRVSPLAFSYGSIQMMWKDGGVCGTMGNIGARTYRIVGVPASTAGQPGHCAIVFMEHDAAGGRYRCKGGQYATGGDEVTSVHAGWNYDDVGGRRPMVFHQSIAWGVNHNVRTFIDTLVLRRAFDALDPETRAARCIEFLDQGLALNPFSLVVIEAAIAAAPDNRVLVTLLETFLTRFAPFADQKEYDLYKETVRNLIHGRMGKAAAPSTPEEARALLADLERQGCEDARLLASTWRAMGGEDAFLSHTLAAARRYLESPERTRTKRGSQRFAEMLKAWGGSVRGAEAKRAWAEAVLEVFGGQETLEVRGKASLDPCVSELCRVAGRAKPVVGK